MSDSPGLAKGRIAVCLLVAVAAWVAPALAGSDAPLDARGLYELPVPGSYELPVIDRVGRHSLLDHSAKRVSMPDVPPGGCALVSFVYANCSDAGGCPLVLASLRRIDRALASDPALASRVELLTISFDPVHDTPERLASLREHLQPRGQWYFLTSESDQEIRPVLDDFGQDALRLVSAEDGRSLGVIRHIAKVFLVDSDLAIRNVYSSGFLEPDIVLRDIETVLLEERARSETLPDEKR